MDTNKILSADLLDLIFDDRNKEYGAYELRKTYHTRITKSLIFTGLFVTLIFTGVVLANKLNPKDTSTFFIHDEVTLASLSPEEKDPEPIPDLPKKQEPIQVQTEQLTQIKLVTEDLVDAPPTQDELAIAKIDIADRKSVV